jgi:hypothetical protein
MKKIIPSIILFLAVNISIAQECSYCDYVINPGIYGQKFDATKQNVKPQPGDTICMMAGVYNEWTAFYDLAGTKELPIVIINCGGLVTINSTSRGFDTFNSTDFVITGTGDPAIFYGFKITGGSDGIRCNNFSNNYRVDHIRIDGVSNHGFDMKNDPVCSDPRTWRNSGLVNDYVIVHDTYLTNIGREGFYVGDSHYQTTVNCLRGTAENTVVVEEAPIIHCEIYNNIVDWTGNDGIQVGSVTGEALIYNNLIRNFGQVDPAHRSGFQINPGAKAVMYNNQVYDGLGSAFFLSGDGVKIYNNVCFNTKNAVEAYDNLTSSDSRYQVFNNTFANLTGSGIAMLNASFTLNENYFYNNIVHTLTGAKFWGYSSHSAFAEANIKNNLFTNDLASLNLVAPENEDLRLTSGSLLAIDLGDCSLSPGIKTDALGNKRLQGDACDIGAYEFGTEIPNVLSTSQFDLGIKVYPNPVLHGEKLNFKLSDRPKVPTVVTVIDGAGKIKAQLISVEKEFSFALPVHLSKGLYFVNIVTDNSKSTTAKVYID